MNKDMEKNMGLEQEGFSLNAFIGELFGEPPVCDEEGFAHVLIESREEGLAVGMMPAGAWEKIELLDSLVLELGEGNRLAVVWYVDGQVRLDLGAMTVCDAGMTTDVWLGGGGSRQAGEADAAESGAGAETENGLELRSETESGTELETGTEPGSESGLELEDIRVRFRLEAGGELSLRLAPVLGVMLDGIGGGNGSGGTAR